jgi:hypothetical protein
MVHILMSLAPLLAASLAWPLGGCPGWMKEEFELLGVPSEDRGQLTDEYLAAAAFSSRKGPRGRARHAAP